MGFFDVFKRSGMIKLPHNPGHVGSEAYKALDNEVSLVMMNELGPAIESALSRSYNLNDFQVHNLDDEGGHFNREFNITANAGRMKALYSREPWVWAAILAIVKAMVKVDFNVISCATGEVLAKHPLNKLVNGGSVHQDKTALRMSTYIDMIAGGNGLIAMNDMFSNPMQAPVEAVQLKYREAGTPDQVRYIEENGVIEAITLTRLMGYGSALGIQSTIPYEQVIHFKFPNPFDPTWGISLMVAASRPILLDRHKNEFEMAFYLRGATNAGVIETTEDTTKARMERLMRTFEQAFTGKRNWWRTLFLPKGAKWVNSGLTMSEMQHLEGLRENRLTLLAVLGVPPSQLGIVQDVNRATSEAQERVFYENTVIPLLNLVASGWNNSHLLRNVYGGQVKIEPDLSGIQAVEGSIQTRGERAKALDNIATINEQRSIAGLTPLKDADPRGSMFLVELQRSIFDPFAAFATPQPGDVGPSDPNEGKVEIQVMAADDGHMHAGLIDPVTSNGHTTEVIAAEGGEVEPHDHAIVGEAGADGVMVGKVQPGGTDQHMHPDIILTQDTPQEVTSGLVFARMKAGVVSNQDRIRKRYERKYLPSVRYNEAMIIETAKRALIQGRDVRTAIQADLQVRASAYFRSGVPILADAMSDGFDMALATTRSMTLIHTKRNPRFETEDELALQAIKRRTSDRRRKQLEERNIRMFAGFDRTTTEQVMKIIEDGLAEGKTTEQVATEIEEKYGERYKDQAFTIARTETLSAISEGIKWEQDALRLVFDKVEKQWLHVGDVGSNPNARDEHAAFEDAGESGTVPVDFRYTNPTTGAKLLYPRDPAGGAADVINCRCSLVNVIPQDATSNASAILNQGE